MRSTCLFIQGCATAAQSTRMCCSSQNRMNFLPVNCVPLSVMMEFGTPKRWTMSRKNSTTCSDLIVDIGRASIHFVNLSIVTSRWVKPSGRLFEWPNQVEPLDHEGPRDGDHLERLGWEVSLLSVVLTSFAGAYNLLGIGYCGGPVEALSECIPNQGPWCGMMTADPTVDIA